MREDEIHTEFTYKETEISLREFLGDDFYNHFLELTNHDKQEMLSILQCYADSTGFLERIREHFVNKEK